MAFESDMLPGAIVNEDSLPYYTERIQWLRLGRVARWYATAKFTARRLKPKSFRWIISADYWAWRTDSILPRALRSGRWG